MKTKINKVTLSKSGKGDITPKLSIPWSWLQGIGVNEQEREIRLSYDEERKVITVEKIEK